MAVPQGRNGYVSIGGVLIPVYSWTMPSPLNIQVPMPVGNTWGTSHAEGLQTTRFIANVLVRRKSTEVLALSFWNQFQSRTWSSGFDDTSNVAIVASNSRKSFTLSNAKFESFVLTCAIGAAVGLSIAFVAPGKPAEANVTPAAYEPFDAFAPLMFNDVSMGGVSGNWYRASLRGANNHLVNAPFNGTKTAAAWDAGVMTAGLDLTVDTRSIGSEAFAQGASLSLQLAGAATRLFTLGSVIVNNPTDQDSEVTPAQVYKPLSATVNGTPTNPPLVIT
jgi:hypothetical protein